MDNATDTFLPTRSSLLSRLRNASDAAGWQDFFTNYGRLIHRTCLRSGLTAQEAEDVTQETVIAVAKKMPDFEYDRSRGSYKAWLWRVTRNHVAMFLRRKYREGARRAELPASVPGEPPAIENIAAADEPDAAWEEEWRSHLLQRALERVRGRISARTWQIFHLSTVMGWTVERIRESLRCSRTQIYLARHRAGSLVKRELDALRRELE